MIANAKMIEEALKEYGAFYEAEDSRSEESNKHYENFFNTFENFEEKDIVSVAYRINKKVTPAMIQFAYRILDGSEKRKEDDFTNAIGYFKDFLTEKEDLQQLDVLEDFHYQYNNRLIDAKLLNELRRLTGCFGDMDLTERIKKMVNYERVLRKMADKLVSIEESYEDEPRTKEEIIEHNNYHRSKVTKLIEEYLGENK